jgi:deoxyhypusine synthase
MIADLIKNQFIEICVETHPVEDKYFKSYRTHIFWTDKNYKHKALVNIMKNIQQIYIEDKDWCCKEIDMQDLRNKLSDFGIYELIPVERYYFSLEENDE